MKLIDILNKIANGELKEGTRVILGKNDSYEYKGIDDWFMVQCKYLNNEVELIEPQETTDNAKIEELDIRNVDNDTIWDVAEKIQHKLNEVIRYINK